MEPRDTDPSAGPLRGDVVGADGDTLTAADLCRACGATLVQVECWVAEGVLEPAGPRRDDWRFAGAALARTRIALRLERDLEVNAPGVALALELMDEIARLRARLSR